MFPQNCNFVLITQGNLLFTSEFLLSFLLEENDKFFAYKLNESTWFTTVPNKSRISKNDLIRKVKEIINPIFDWKKEGF